MIKTVNLICTRPACGKSFSRLAAEHNRNTRAGRQPYCSISCCAKHSNFLNPRGGNVTNLRLGSNRDELSPFRWFTHTLNSRTMSTAGQAKYGKSEITPQYLKALWGRQNGMCPITGWKLVLPISTMGWPEGPVEKRASLDRIDCSRGYLEDNIRFVSVMFNFARNEFSDDAVYSFCRAVAEHNELSGSLT